MLTLKLQTPSRRCKLMRPATEDVYERVLDDLTINNPLSYNLEMHRQITIPIDDAEIINRPIKFVIKEKLSS